MLKQMGIRIGRSRCGNILKSGGGEVSEDLSDKVTLGQNSERGQAEACVKEGEECSRQGNSKYKGREVGT